MRLACCALLISLTCPSSARADDAAGRLSSEDVRYFESSVRPVLVRSCYECHSAESGVAEGGLRLDSREGVLRGGERGPAVVPGDPDAGWLLKAISHLDPDLQMPPRQKLPEREIHLLREWVRRGAPDPRVEEPGPGAASRIKRDAGDFWAYQPVRRTEPPAVRNADWPRQSLDHYVLSRLEQEQLAPSPDAEPRVLLRRVYFDLIGLPPGPEEISAFASAVETSGMDAALAELCDRLMELPQFGERWGRHWLDVARFGESSGKEANISFPYAFRYRDYVIDAVQEDLPYNRFLTEQIAGDLLPYEDAAERSRLLIATGFLAVGTKNLSEMNRQQFLADLVDEQIDSLTRAVLASSIACARCHDHKSDPFTMQDYYALAGIFHSSKTCYGTAVSPSNNVGGDPLPLPREAGDPIFHKSITAAQVAKHKADLAALRREEQEKRAAQWKAIAAGEDASEIFTISDALRILWRTGGIEGELEKVDDEGRALPLAMGVVEGDKIGNAPLLQRGEVARPGEKVPRGFPASLSRLDTPRPPDDQSGRLQLAAWLTHPDHPLTARVFVNRVWQHLLGEGLVRTTDDFGATAEMPSHPELLDHLAMEFVSGGWSLKRLVRTLVLSRTYRQSSEWNESAFLADPDNRWLWRMPKRRLEAEAIRDAMLAASGELDLQRPQGSLVAVTIGDRPISLIGLDKRLPPDLDGTKHRSVYLPVIRDRLPDVLELFDFAEPSLVTGTRETTNVPVQALYLMNSPFVIERAKALAERLKTSSEDPDERICLAFQLCFSRRPDAEEQAISRAFLRTASTDETTAAIDSRWIDFCQGLLSTAEFRNLD